MFAMLVQQGISVESANHLQFFNSDYRILSCQDYLQKSEFCDDSGHVLSSLLTH